MKPARILLLLIAIAAGGLAAWLATRGDRPEPETTIVTEVREEPRTQILVASRAIGVGERLRPEMLSWQDWPEGAVRPEYVTVSANPEAREELTNTVARFEIFIGEPIREQKLVRSDQGYLSAVLEQGKRGVSIGVTPASGSGGFIVPNDRVDVVLTRSTPAGEISETILQNVKVLALGARLGETGTTGAPADPNNPRAEMFAGATIATLELDPRQSEAVINAAAIGQLSLVLRSIIDFREETQGAVAQRQTSQSIRVIRYGQDTNVRANARVLPPQEPLAVPAADAPALSDPANAIAVPAAAPAQ
ncbi:Flp pilus assembly protein CpaB [Arsenicitalea aurantiaca]|uniref:Flp pilus assembly protein CpaB n=1 Tax=Arsenicitalea aurantiaca TaxID=1783274 RepID=A0A433X250_9HYPH|nr:Flp pilus assembly protein CpaB [Arsenicitalea aurantiaca]RUT28196.1 Flp pilus assembly protein CpaB [Arsenicitalea aurantiaca]